MRCLSTADKCRCQSYVVYSREARSGRVVDSPDFTGYSRAEWPKWSKQRRYTRERPQGGICPLFVTVQERSDVTWTRPLINFVLWAELVPELCTGLDSVSVFKCSVFCKHRVFTLDASSSLVPFLLVILTISGKYFIWINNSISFTFCFFFPACNRVATLVPKAHCGEEAMCDPFSIKCSLLFAQGGETSLARVHTELE